MEQLYNSSIIYGFYSIMSILSLFLSGFLVDKFTSRKIVPLMNLPLLLAMITLIIFDHSFSSFVFFLDL